MGGLVAQAVRRSPPAAGVPSLRLGPSMWVSWWTKRGLDRFFAGFLPFSPITNFIPPVLHTHLIHFVSFHQPLWWCDRRGRPAPLPFTDLQYRGFIASHPSTRPCVGHELGIFIYFILWIWWIMVKWIVVMKIQPSICLDDWGKPRKNPSQVGWHQDLKPGPPKCKSRALPRSHLARLNFNFVGISIY